MIKRATRGAKALRDRLNPLIDAHNDGYVAESEDIAVNQDPESGRVSLSLKPGVRTPTAAATPTGPVIPEPPASGDYVLTAQDGVLTWAQITDC